MSTWRNVGITYLKYADICATHVRNALKEPAKTKAKSSSNMHARIVQWEAGKRGDPRELHPAPLRVAPPSTGTGCCPHVSPVQSLAEEGGRGRGRLQTQGGCDTAEAGHEGWAARWAGDGVAQQTAALCTRPRSLSRVICTACASRRLCFRFAPTTLPLAHACRCSCSRISCPNRRNRGEDGRGGS